jgi:hypothetical protein
MSRSSRSAGSDSDNSSDVVSGAESEVESDESNGEEAHDEVQDDDSEDSNKERNHEYGGKEDSDRNSESGNESDDEESESESEENGVDEITKMLGGLAKKVAEGDLESVEEVVEEGELSSSSVDSSDAEYGAKTIMRKLFEHVKSVDVVDHSINDSTAEEVSEEEIKANPGKYYVANFRGDRLDYFSGSHRGKARREYVRTAVDGSVSGAAPAYKSIAAINIGKKHEKDPDAYKVEINKIETPKKLLQTTFIKKYKSPTHFLTAVKDISPTYGNPVISTSKDTEVTTAYADHPKKDAKLHPKYGDKVKDKPKHRLIGMATVFVHEASDYIKKPKADIERLRVEGKVGGKSGVERNNQEIIFADEIASDHVAGYVPLAYPNLSKEYDEEDKRLFGLTGVSVRTTTKSPKTLGKKAKDSALYPTSRALQWRVAEKFVKNRNPEGELIWVDREGKFRKFKTKDGRARKLDFDDTTTSEEDAKSNTAADDLDIFNYVGDSSNLTHENVQKLLRVAFLKNGKSGVECDAMLSNSVAVISEDGSLDDSLRDAILHFIGQYPQQDHTSIALCRGAIVGRQIVGNTHWSALHLRRVGNEVKSYHMDSLGDKTPRAVGRVLGAIHGTTLNPDLAENETYRRAIERLSTTIFQPCKDLLCTKQKDGYSCGYHAVFNMARMQTAADVEVLEDVVIQDGVGIEINDFITARKADLKSSFNGAIDKRIRAVSAADFDDDEVDLNVLKAAAESISISSDEHIEKLQKLINLEKSVRQKRPDSATDLSKLNIEILYRKILFETAEGIRYDALIAVSEVGEAGDGLSDKVESFLEKLCNAETAQNPQSILPLLTRIIAAPAILFSEIEWLQKELDDEKPKPSLSPRDTSSGALYEAESTLKH